MLKSGETKAIYNCVGVQGPEANPEGNRCYFTSHLGHKMVLVNWGKYGAVTLVTAEVALASLIQGAQTQAKRRPIPRGSIQRGLNDSDVVRVP